MYTEQKSNKLSQKHLTFCLELLRTNNPGMAYAAAYNKDFDNLKERDICQKCAHRLLKNAGVKEYIHQLNKKMESEKIASASELQEILTTIARRDSKNSREDEARIKAIDTLAKLKGLYNKDANQKDVNITVTLDGIDAADMEP